MSRLRTVPSLTGQPATRLEFSDMRSRWDIRFSTSSSMDKKGAISFCSSALGSEALRDGPAETASASTNVSGVKFASLWISVHAVGLSGVSREWCVRRM